LAWKAEDDARPGGQKEGVYMEAKLSGESEERKRLDWLMLER
jgi:hypothetical protein